MTGGSNSHGLGHDRLIIIADDLTGALDASGPFADAGLQTTLMLDAGGRDTWPEGVVAVSTESRLMDQDGSAARMVQLAHLAGDRPLFKKIDSLLRGNPAHEIATLYHARRPNLTVVAPAFPALGRCTVGSKQYVQGIPVDQGETDPFSMPASSDLYDLLHKVNINATPLPVPLIRDRNHLRAALKEAVSRHGIVIVDAQRQGDLNEVARVGMALDGDVLWCGSGGLALALASTAPASEASTSYAPVEKLLVICGSLHRVSLRQCQRLAVLPGIEMVQMAESEDGHAIARRVERALVTSRAVLVQSTRSSSPVNLCARLTLLERFTQMAENLPVFPSLGIVAVGGDTTASIMSGLSVHHLTVGGTISHGIPYGRAHGHGQTWVVVTKSGAFGTRGTLLMLARHLLGDETTPIGLLRPANPGHE